MSCDLDGLEMPGASGKRLYRPLITSGPWKAKRAGTIYLKLLDTDRLRGAPE